MTNLCEEDTPHWFVIHTHPQQEQRADSNLRAWNVETFFPRLRKRGRASKAGGKEAALKPLFPRYIFARFKAADLLHKVRFTRGICDVVNFGGQPTPVSGEVIAMMKSRMGEDGAIMLCEEFEPGSPVVVKEGPLKGFAGIFQRNLRGTNRVMLLLQTVSYQASVVVEREHISKLNQGRA